MFTVRRSEAWGFPPDRRDDLTEPEWHPLLGGQDGYPGDDEAAPQAGQEAGGPHGHQALHQEGEHQLEAAQAAHHVGRDQPQGQRQARERHQAACWQPWEITVSCYYSEVTTLPTKMDQLRGVSWSSEALCLSLIIQ